MKTARSFVISYLHQRPGGRALAADVLAAGHTAGFTVDELKTARARARHPRITTTKTGYAGGWVWALAPLAVDLEDDYRAPTVTCGQCDRPAHYRATLVCCRTHSGVLCLSHYAEAHHTIDRLLADSRRHLHCTHCKHPIPAGTGFHDLYDITEL